MALRTQTVRGIRSDFGNLYSDKMCPLQCGDVDTLQNILTCKVLLQHHSTKDITSRNIRYEDVYKTDIMTQKQVTELYKQLIEVRSEILQSVPVTETGPVHGAHAVQKLSTLSSEDICSSAFGN